MFLREIYIFLQNLRNATYIRFRIRQKVLAFSHCPICQPPAIIYVLYKSFVIDFKGISIFPNGMDNIQTRGLFTASIFQNMYFVFISKDKFKRTRHIFAAQNHAIHSR